jgi:hypothetical protein
MQMRIRVGLAIFIMLNSLLRSSNYLDTHALGSYNRRPLSLGRPSYGDRLL